MLFIGDFGVFPIIKNTHEENEYASSIRESFNIHVPSFKNLIDEQLKIPFSKYLYDDWKNKGLSEEELIEAIAFEEKVGVFAYANGNYKVSN